MVALVVWGYLHFAGLWSVEKQERLMNELIERPVSCDDVDLVYSWHSKISGYHRMRLSAEFYTSLDTHTRSLVEMERRCPRSFGRALEIIRSGESVYPQFREFRDFRSGEEYEYFQVIHLK